MVFIDLLGVRPPSDGDRRAPYFVDAVTDRLIDRYGPKAVYEGGLNVYTTLNPALQSAAEKDLTEGIRSLHGRNVSQGALVAIDPRTGEVKALVGGADYRKSQYNRAVSARRQPGSAFKPFVYAAAMNSGVSPLDKITDGPVNLVGDDGSEWQPKDYNNKFIGQTTVVNAFALSLNAPAVKLGQRAGITQVADTARSCGIRSPLDEVPSLALGVSGVTPLELTASYAVFDNRGTRAEPRLIRRVTSSDGTIDDAFNANVQEVMEPSIARMTDFLLRSVVESGTGQSVRSIPLARGKTGTTQDDKDAWFVGYTPELVTGVWVGDDRPSPMRGVFGGNGPAPIWRNFMHRALEILPKRADLPVYAPAKPQPKEDVATSGDASGVAASLKDAPEWQNRPLQDDSDEAEQSDPSAVSSRSIAYASRLVKVRICTDTGLRANRYCPNTEMEEVPSDVIPSVCTQHNAQTARQMGANDDEETQDSATSEVSDSQSPE